MYEFEELLSLQQELNLPFTDKTFPNNTNYMWKRAHEIYPQLEIFNGPIKPQNVFQGLLGDCYLLSALSVLAEKEHLIRKLFHNTVNKFGIYAVWINYNGEWVQVIIDDYFPCTQNGPAYSRSNNELWVMLLEKAYAKVYGGYSIIEGGNPAIALRDLTGAPYENRDQGTADELWQYCQDNQGYLLTAYTNDHAYAILGFSNEKIKIRNPQGKNDWIGDYNSIEGVFWMSKHDFRKHFTGVGVCKIQENYIYTSIQIYTQQICQIKLDQDSHLYVSLNQNDDRQSCMPNYRYSFGRIIVADHKFGYITGIYKADRNIFVEITLKAGEYYIITDIQWQYPQIQPFITLNIYSKQNLQIQRVQGIDYMNCVKNIIRDYSENKVEKQQTKNIVKRNGIIDGYLFFHYQNLSSQTALKELMYFQELIGYQYIESFDTSLQISFTLPPNQTALILLTQIRSTSGKCQYTYKTESQFVPNASFPNTMILQPIDASKMQLAGKHKIYGTNRSNIQPKIFEVKNEQVELSQFESKLFYYFHDCLSPDFWDTFIFWILILNLILNFILIFHRTHFFQLVILTLFILNFQQKFKKSTLRILSQAQLFQVFLEVITRLLGFESMYFTLPTIAVSGFYRFFILFNILIDFLTYISILEFVVHYEIIDTEVIEKINTKLMDYAKKLI